MRISKMEKEITTELSNTILLILPGENHEAAKKAAFQYAKAYSKKLVVLQILTSILYHYGHHDVIATRSSKRQFLLHIRQEVLRKGITEAQGLRERAVEEGISLEIHSVETEDIVSVALSEAIKDYEVIFLPKEKRKIFPFFEKTLEQQLEKKVSSRIIPC